MFKMVKISYSRIKSIRKVGKKRTFDISVPKTHNFILSNNLLSHNSQDQTLLGKMPGEDDRKRATDQLRRDNLITSKQVVDLGQLLKGQFYIVEPGKAAKKRYFFLPRTMYWREGYGSFYNIWKNLRDTWKSISFIKDKIAEDYAISHKKIVDEEKIKAHMKKEEEERNAIEEEEKELEDLQEREEKKALAKLRAKENVKRVKESIPKEEKEKTKITNPKIIKDRPSTADIIRGAMKI